MTKVSSSNEAFSGRFVLHNRREDIEQAEKAVLAALAAHHYDNASQFAVRLSLEEALSNAFKHGNKGDERKSVRLSCAIDRGVVELEVQDEGDGFDPQSVPDPTQSENLEIPSGRGLKLIQAMMTEVQIMPPGNRVRMRYVNPRG
jgi:serine/threonine-protein kinase RsbW